MRDQEKEKRKGGEKKRKGKKTQIANEDSNLPRVECIKQLFQSYNYLKFKKVFFFCFIGSLINKKKRKDNRN